MKRMIASIATVVALAATPALAEVIEVEMYTRSPDGENNVFGQELIMAEPGDTIRFLPTDPGHNAQSVKGAVPEGQEPFRGRINQEVDYEVAEPGLTAVVCLPHQGVGMVALIVVGGDVSNAEQIREARIPGKGGQKIGSLVDEAVSQQES